MNDSSRVAEDVEVDLRSVFGAIGRRLPLVILLALVVGAGVFAYLSTIEPRYRAEATLLIETSATDDLTPGDQGLNATLLDQEGIQSQVELVRSRDVAEAVIAELNLTEIAEFDPEQAEPSLIDRVMGLVGLGNNPSDLPMEDLVLAEFRERLGVSAIQQTRVIVVTFESVDPQLAAEIVNAVARQYITLQRDVRRDNAANATAWLQAEIDALSQRVIDAETAVEEFRTDENLFLAGRDTNQRDVTLVAQQLADLSAELTRVQSQRAEAEATAAMIRANIENDAALTSLDVLNSSLIQRLREQVVLLRAEIAEASATLLPGHPRIRALNAQIADLEREIAAEARNILTGLENETELALGYETQLAQQIDALKATATVSSQAEVELRALERIANAERDLLETYLALAREAISRQNSDSLPINVRVISPASPPIEPYYPPTLGMTAVAVIITLMIGAAFLLVRELASGRAVRPVARPALPAVPDDVRVDGHVRWADDGDVRRMMPTDPGDRAALANRIEQALTSIAQKLRQDEARRVLITMAAPIDEEEGRPLAAVALARTLARTGARVLLVDLHSDDADRMAMGDEEQLPGFGDLFAGEASFAQVIFRDRSSPAHFIPRGKSVDLGAGDRFAELTDALDQTYDHVIYDASDSTVSLLGGSAAAAVVVTEVAPSDPRTIRAYEAIKAESAAEIMLLVTDPAPTAEQGAAA